MKKSLITLIFSVFVFSAIAQSNIRLDNYWGNINLINPAAVYDKYEAVFNIAARKQWLGIQGAPSTLFASGSTYLENYHTQLGLFLIQDKVGYTSLTNVNASYAYAVTLNYEWQFHLGLAGNYQSLSYDMSAVPSENDPVITQGLVPRSLFNADIGAELTNKNFRIGVASQNLLSLFQADRPLQTNTNFIYARFYQNSNNIINLGGGVCGIQYADIYQVEFNVTTYFKFKQDNGLTYKPDIFDLGLFYRTRSELGMILGFNLSEAIHVSYSYDYHFGNIGLGSYGTNEILLTYNLMRKPLCRNCWY